jgi:hypothetical protein
MLHSPPMHATLPQFAAHSPPLHKVDSRMPTCTCGCNQVLKHRAITNHLRGRATPRLVTAVVKAGRTNISPPRLNPSKKLRSSQPYFPSPDMPAAVNEGPDFVMSEGGGAAEGRDSHREEDDTDEVGIQHCIDAVRKDLWSGLCHDDDDDGADDEGEGEDSDANDGGEGADDSGEGGSVGYDSCDGLDDNENGLSALHMMGEDFEHNAVANGECTGNSCIQIA